MSKRVLFLSHQEARRRAVEAVKEAPDGYKITIEPPRRTEEQSALMWVLLEELAKQVVWHGQKLTKEEWKDMATASLKNQKVIPGIGGGFVVLGARTSKMTKAEISEVIEFVYAFGAQNGIEWKEME